MPLRVVDIGKPAWTWPLEAGAIAKENARLVCPYQTELCDSAGCWCQHVLAPQIQAAIEMEKKRVEREKAGWPSPPQQDAT